MRFAVYHILLLSSVAFAQPQQGDHWDRTPVTSEIVEAGDATLRQVFLSTVSVNSATGTYLGVYAGAPVVMTARHVMPDQAGCTGRDVVFYAPSRNLASPLRELHFSCDRLLGAWNDVEISLFTLAPNPANQVTLKNRGLKPGFDEKITQFESLITMGHGGEQNPAQALTVDQGPDCYVASATGDFRFRSNTTWSMALGCNESAGDSGSPIVDRNTGTLLGIVWGGHTDKPDQIANSSYLRSMTQANSPDIWLYLNYASPMPVLGDFFQYLLRNQQLDPQLQKTLNEMLGL
jgi:hypothetical protein